MKPFDLEAAKRGEAVCTKGGMDVRILCFDGLNEDNEPIVGLIKDEARGRETVAVFNNEGLVNFRYDLAGRNDLRMKLPKHHLWTNVYKTPEGRYYSYGSYLSEKEARNAIDHGIEHEFIASRLVYEWEE